MHAVIQVPLDGVVGSCNCRRHPFVICTVDVTACFSRQTVSALTLEPLTLFCTADTLLIVFCLFWSKDWLLAPPPSPIVSFTSMGFFCPSNTSPATTPSCILSQHEVRCPCSVERLVDASPFPLLLDTGLQGFLKPSSSIHVPCCRAVTILGS